MKFLGIARLVFLLCVIFVTLSIAEEQIEIKGTVINVELEPSSDPANPNLWPCLLMENKEAMLVGSPDILEELSYLTDIEVTLQVKKFPKQKFVEKEYECFEVSDIVKMDTYDYISSRRAIEEFKQVLKVRDVVDETGRQKIEGALRSIWFDRNENGIIDSGDRLFMTSRTTGKSNDKYLLYPSHVVIRQYKDKTTHYNTFILNDPLPKSFEPAIMGRLKYDAEKDVYSVDIDKIYRGGDDSFREPKEEEKTAIIKENKILKPLIGEKVLLVGDNYENLLWYGDAEEEITRQGGEYIITVKGNISIAKKIVQKPWKLSLVLLKDSQGKIYELRQVGYVGFWKSFTNKKELAITGALRSIVYYEGKPTRVIEVFRID